MFTFFSLAILEAPRRQKSPVSIYSSPASALHPAGAQQSFCLFLFLMNWASHIVKCVLTWDKDSGHRGLFVKPSLYEVGAPRKPRRGDQDGVLVATLPVPGGPQVCAKSAGQLWEHCPGSPHCATTYLTELRAGHSSLVLHWCAEGARVFPVSCHQYF